MSKNVMFNYDDLVEHAAFKFSGEEEDEGQVNTSTSKTERSQTTDVEVETNLDNSNPKGFLKKYGIKILIGIIVLGVFGFCLWYFVLNKKSEENVLEPLKNTDVINTEVNISSDNAKLKNYYNILDLQYELFDDYFTN